MRAAAYVRRQGVGVTCISLGRVLWLNDEKCLTLVLIE